MNTVINLTKSTVPPGAEASKMRQHFLEHQHETFTIHLNYAQACALWDLLAVVGPPPRPVTAGTTAVRDLVNSLKVALPTCYSESGDVDIFMVDDFRSLDIGAIPDDTAEFFQP